MQRGDISLDDEKAVEADFQARLDTAFAETHASGEPAELVLTPPGSDDGREAPRRRRSPPRWPPTTLDVVVDALAHVPDGFTANPKLERQLQARRTEFEP